MCMLAECGDEITVEPLANLPVRTDVVVDMDPFYARFPDPHPIIRVSQELPAAKPPHDLEAYVRLEDCLECGLCLSACPIAATDPSFTDPAALSAAGRLLDEPRQRPRGRARMDQSSGGRLAVHDLHGVRRGLPGRDRAHAGDHRGAPHADREG